MRKYVDFNTEWYFFKCPGQLPKPSEWLNGACVCLPHTWYTDEDYYQGNAIYQKRFFLKLKTGQQAILRFEGVDKVCNIFLNGQCVGSHEGGYTRFAVDLTNALYDNKENLLTVIVNNEMGETVSPLGGDFVSFGGIYRKASLILVDFLHFPLMYYGTEGVLLRATIQKNEGVLTAAVANNEMLAEKSRVRYTLLDEDGNRAAQVEVDSQEVACLRVKTPQLWNGTQNPYLYTVSAELLLNNIVHDYVELKVGFRRIELDAEKGFFLNGKHLKLHGVAKHQDTATVFSAAKQEHWDCDIQLIEEIGANAVRLSHYPHPQEIYNLCDQKGLIVWTEIPLLKLTMNEGLLDNACQQLQEMIFQGLHHPSICFWGIQNEVAIFGDKPYMSERLQVLNQLAQKLDSDRFTVSANLHSVLCDSRLNQITDSTAYNVYFGWYYGKMQDHAAFLDEFHRINPQMPLGISEYGVDCNPAFHNNTPQVNDYSEEFQALYHETIYPYMEQRDYVWGSFVWNMFDFVSAIRNDGGVKARNLKGLVTHDRATRKDSFYYYKAKWSHRPFVHIAQKRFVKRVNEFITVKVYSNQPKVILNIGNKTFSEQICNGSAVFMDIPLYMGENYIFASAGEYSDKALFIRVNEPEQKYVYVDNTPGLNVRNWFIDEAEEARLFPEDAYSIRDRLSVLVCNAQVMAIAKQMQPLIADLMLQAPDTFTLERVIKHERPEVSDEDIRLLNIAFTKIYKQENKNEKPIITR